MSSESQLLDTALPDISDRVHECQEMLMKIEELSKQKEELIKRMAVCEGIANERRRMFNGLNKRKSGIAKETVGPVQGDFGGNIIIVTKYLENLEELQSAYRELILESIKVVDPSWLRCRREKLLTAFQLAKDLHLPVMQKTQNFVVPYKRKRRPDKSKRGCQHSWKY